MTCNVCCEKYTKRDHMKITCPRTNCAFEACRECVKTYIEQQLSNPHCMSCRFEYEDEYIIPYLTKIYYNKEYKNKKINVLYELEKSLIPSTIEDAKRTLQIQKEHVKLKELNDELHDIVIRINQKKMYIDDLKNQKDPSKKKFIMKCQQKECNGYLSSGYKCELCDKHTCPQCIEPLTKGEEHTCDEDAVASANLIKSNTKPCPKCSQRISKIEGCDQMWCTECNTPFSWKNGTIINGHIHNPHYFEWLQQRGTVQRTHGDIPCGGIPAFTVLRSNRTLNKGRHILAGLTQFTAHIYNMEMPRQMDRDEHKDLRIKYILKQIDEETWKSSLAKRIQTKDKQEHHRQLMAMLFQVTLDILRRGESLTEQCTNYEEIIQHMEDEYFEIIRYVNQIKMKRAMTLRQGDYIVIRNNYYSFRVIYYSYKSLSTTHNTHSILI